MTDIKVRKTIRKLLDQLSVTSDKKEFHKQVHGLIYPGKERSVYLKLYVFDGEVNYYDR